MKSASLTLKMVVLVFFLGLVLVGSSTFMYERAVKGQDEHLREGVRNYAASLVTAIGAQFFERYGDVQAFTYNDVFQKKETANMVAALNSYAALYQIYDLILFIDTNGRLIASNQLDPKGKVIMANRLRDKNFSSEPWFQAVLSERFSEDSKKGFVGT